MRQVIQNIHEANDSVRPFPPPEDVFVEPVEKYFKHLLPLVSMNLSLFDPDLSGWVHFVTPIEPYDGVIGQYTKRYHAYYLRENWIGFRIRDGKYELPGDFRYFYLEKPSITARVKNQFDGQITILEKRYRTVRKEYAEKRQQFLEHGAIYHQWAKKDSLGKYMEKDRVELIQEIGGQCGCGNWSSGFPLLEQEAVDQEGEEILNMIPLTQDNRPFLYIGDLHGFNYIEGAADGILLFYDPVDKIVLFTFNWT